MEVEDAGACGDAAGIGRQLRVFDLQQVDGHPRGGPHLLRERGAREPRRRGAARAREPVGDADRRRRPGHRSDLDAQLRQASQVRRAVVERAENGRAAPGQPCEQGQRSLLAARVRRQRYELRHHDAAQTVQAPRFVQRAGQTPELFNQARVALRRIHQEVSTSRRQADPLPTGLSHSTSR